MNQDLELADRFAKEALNARGQAADIHNSKSEDPKFKNWCDLARVYKNARDIANNHRQHNILSEAEAANENAAYENFIAASLDFQKARSSVAD